MPEPTQKLRICFAGTPGFAASHLLAVLEAGHEVIAVYTQPDRPSGRGKKLQASPVKKIASQFSIPVYQPQSLKSDQQEQQLKSLRPDLLLVVAYGLILPSTILDIPRFGCINVHASLLPRWRGAAPIERALLAGDTSTGVTIMQMDEGLDTGAMLLCEPVLIGSGDTRLDIERQLEELGAKVLLRCLHRLSHYQEVALKQDDSLATYAKKLEKSEALIDWNCTVDLIDRTIRAGIGRTPAFTFLDGLRLRILKATLLATSADGSAEPAASGTILQVDNSGFTVACQNSSLHVESIQLPGKKAMSVRDAMNSRPSLFTLGGVFSSSESAL